LADQPPASPVLIRQVYEALQTESPVTFAGMIYADSMSPFDNKQAVFTVIDLPRPGHDHEDPGDCPFCRRELKEAKFAIVRIIDESGKPVPVPADTLLGLKKNQRVIVSGIPTMMGETLLVRLNSLYILNMDAASQLAKQLWEVNP
jgi:hypothetical protein